MRYLSREIGGWILVVLGLYTFYLCFQFLSHRQVFETAPLMLIGIFVFRGGIHLLKVAIAAEVCREARSRPPLTRPVLLRAAAISPRTPGEPTP